MMRRYLFLVTILGVVFLKESFSIPVEHIVDSDVLDPVALTVDNSSAKDSKREQRSPQFGLLGGDYSDYSDYDSARFFGNKRKFHRRPHYHHKPHGLIGHGCRGYGCGEGWQPNYGGHYTGQGASFASASAGSVGGSGPYGGGHSQANAQSASFNVGPFSASFSAAQSSAGQGIF